MFIHDLQIHKEACVSNFFGDSVHSTVAIYFEKKQTKKVKRTFVNHCGPWLLTYVAMLVI